MKCIRINWDTEGKKVDLPSAVWIPPYKADEYREMEAKDPGSADEILSDYLSDEIGWLMYGFIIDDDENTYTTDELDTYSENLIKISSYRKMIVKDYKVYICEFNGVGLSAFVFKKNRMITFANRYSYNSVTAKYEISDYAEMCKKELSEILFTEEELSGPLKSYDEYHRKEHFIRNYMIQNIDAISMFESSSANKRSISSRVFNPISFCYIKKKDIPFMEKQKELLDKLDDLLKEKDTDYQFQYEAFRYQMADMEYLYNNQRDYDVMNAFGNVGYKRTLEEYFSELGFNDIQKKAYMAARNGILGFNIFPRIKFTEVNTEFEDYDEVYAEIPLYDIEEIYRSIGRVPMNDSIEEDHTYVSGEVSFNFEKDGTLSEVLIFPVYAYEDEDYLVNGDLIPAPKEFWDLEEKAREYLLANK